jgi:hypothetical protein
VDIQETPLPKKEYSPERKAPFHGGKVQVEKNSPTDE